MKTLVCLMVLSAPVAAHAAAQEGFKQTDRLIKKANETIRGVEEARGEIEKALGVYNTILKGGAGDTRKLYKDLTKAVDSTDKKVESVRKKNDEMQTEAYAFFQEWSQSIEKISSESLKARSQQRLNETRRDFGEILSAGRQAGAALDPFMGNLRDQIVYLGHDLNPSAVSSLAPDAEKLNAQAKELFGRIDDLNRIAREYVLSLKPE